MRMEGKTLKLVILRLSKALGLFYVTKRLAKRKLLIFCYHGFELENEASFRSTLFMRPEMFARRLKMIKRHGCAVLRLDEAVDGLQRDTLPNNSICLTIDDGFYGVSVHAVPLLKQYGFPATLYLTSYYSEKGTPIFRLVIQYMFWKTKQLKIDLQDKGWAPVASLDLSDKREVDQAIWQIINFGESACDEPERQRICAELGDCLGVDYAAIRESRILSLLVPKEIEELDRDVINVQLHTHRHHLSSSDHSDIRREVVENRRFLERLVDYPLVHLCYPSGLWDIGQWPCLESLHIKTATTCNPAMNRPDTPLLGLYRVVDDDKMLDIEFEAELCGFAEFIRLVSGRRKRLDAARRLGND